MEEQAVVIAFAHQLEKIVAVDGCFVEERDDDGAGSGLKGHARTFFLVFGRSEGQEARKRQKCQEDEAQMCHESFVE